MKKLSLKKFAIDAPTQVSCSEYGEIYKNTYFEQHILTAGYRQQFQTTGEQPLLY